MTEDDLAEIDLAARFEDKPKIVALVAAVRRLQRENAALRAQLDDNFGGKQ